MGFIADIFHFGHNSTHANVHKYEVNSILNRNKHYEFDNIYEFKNKKTNHQELFYRNSDLIKTVSLNKIYKGKLLMWYHLSSKNSNFTNEYIDVAVKIIEDSDAAENQNNEPEMLYCLKDEPEIIYQFGYHIDVSNKRCIIALELCKGGDLFNYVETNFKYSSKEIKVTYSKCDVKNIVRWLVQCINKCHKKNICHMDLKLDNIMLYTENRDNPFDTSILRLIDFGGAKLIKDDGKNIKYSYICTSPHYASPEVINAFQIPIKWKSLRNYELTGENLCKIDVWHIGVIAYILLYGRYPFDYTNANQSPKINKNIEIFKEIRKCKYPEFTKISDVNGDLLCDEDGIDFIKKSMCFDPSERATISDLINHSWLKIS